MNHSISELVERRRTGLSTSTHLWRRSLQNHVALYSRLSLDATLEGHRGCVNRLSWNQNGSLLASGSDDTAIYLWDSIAKKKRFGFDSGHSGNIFAVKFLPNTDDKKMVSGAMDNEVRFHHLLEGGEVSTHEYLCHSGRVKAMDIENDNPNMFWSASEDGTVRQFDIRTHHACSQHSSSGDSNCNNVLIDLSNTQSSARRRTIEITGISVNPIFSQYVAIATRDPFVRVYDRRMLSVSSIGRQNSYNTPVSVFAPPQVMRSEHCKANRSYHSSSVFTTHVVFSPNGRELLANYSAEHVYLFDLFSSLSSPINDFTFPPPQQPPLIYVDDEDIYSRYSRIKRRKVVSNEEEKYIEKKKVLGNKAFHAKDFSLAIFYYSLAIQGFECLASRIREERDDTNNNERLSIFSRLFSNRAWAYLKRNWKGDTDLALWDTERAIHLDRSFYKAKLRRIEALKKANLVATACKYAKEVLEEHKMEAGVEEAIQELGVLSITSPKDDISLPSSSSSAYHQVHCYHNQSTEGSESDSDDEDKDSRREETELPPKNEEPIGPMLTQEKYFYSHRFVGHSNMATDIKEASFLGEKGEMIGAGSDDGRMFIWDKKTEKLVDIIQADADVVNCIQSHPSQCMIATSGIESVVRLWSPLGSRSPDKATEFEKIRNANQKRMSSERVGVRLRDIPPEVIRRLLFEQMSQEDPTQRGVDCRMS